MASIHDLAGEEWRGRVGSSWASEWARTDRSFAELTGHLVDAVSTAAPQRTDLTEQRVLDIGCGAGETAFRLTDTRPDLAVTGLDLSDDLIDVAKARTGGRATPTFVRGDATRWRGEIPFDAALSRHGVMFFADPVSAFAHIRTLMAPGAPLAFTCFAARDANPWASEVAALVGAPPPGGPDAPGPFAFADEQRVHRILEAAGWRGLNAERIDYRYVAGAGDDPVADALDFFMRIGPAARLIATLDPAARVALRPRMIDWLAAHLSDGEVRFPASAWLWRAAA